MQKLMIVLVTALELNDFNKKQCFETLIKTLHLFAPNMQHTLDNFSDFSLIYLTMKTCQTSFFQPCFDIFLLF